MASFISADMIRDAVGDLLDANCEVARVLHHRMAFRDVEAFTTFPFLAIGHTRASGDAPEPVEEHIVTVHLWLAPGETAAAEELMGSIRRALDEGPLRIQGALVRRFSHEKSSARLAPELEALHATVRYRLRISRALGRSPTRERMRGETVPILVSNQMGKRAG